MRKPSTIRIGGREWKFRRRLPKSMPDESGLCHYEKAQIDIRSGQSPIDERDTVLHEVMHAILYCQGREYGEEVEETYVRALATGLIATLQDNPQFAQWLSKRADS